MDREEGLGPGGEGRLDLGLVEVPGVRPGVHEDGGGAGVADGERRGDHGEVRDDHLVALADPEGGQRQVERDGAVADRHGVLRPAMGGEGLLEGLDVLPGGADPAGADRLGDVFELPSVEAGGADGDEAHWPSSRAGPPSSGAGSKRSLSLSPM